MFNLIEGNATISLILNGGKESTTWRESYTEYRQLLKDKADESVRKDKALQQAIDAQLSKTQNQLRLATRDILSIDEKLSITIFAYCAWSMFLPVVSYLKLWTDITHSIDIISITMIILGVVFLAIAIRAERVLLIDRRNGLWKSFTGSINSVADSVKEAQTPRTIANLFDPIMWIACRLSVALASCMIFLLAFEFIFYALIGCLQSTPGITMDDTTSLTCFFASLLTTILICLVVFMLVSSLIVKALRKNFYREELRVVSSDEIEIVDSAGDSIKTDFLYDCIQDIARKNEAKCSRKITKQYKKFAKVNESSARPDLVYFEDSRARMLIYFTYYPVKVESNGCEVIKAVVSESGYCCDSGQKQDAKPQITFLFFKEKE